MKRHQPRQVGRPPAGFNGEPASKYPQLAARVPRATLERRLCREPALEAMTRKRTQTPPPIPLTSMLESHRMSSRFTRPRWIAMVHGVRLTPGLSRAPRRHDRTGPLGATAPSQVRQTSMRSRRITSDTERHATSWATLPQNVIVIAAHESPLQSSLSPPAAPMIRHRV